MSFLDTALHTLTIITLLATWLVYRRERSKLQRQQERTTELLTEVQECGTRAIEKVEAELDKVKRRNRELIAELPRILYRRIKFIRRVMEGETWHCGERCVTLNVTDRRRGCGRCPFIYTDVYDAMDTLRRQDEERGESWPAVKWPTRNCPSED